MNAADNIAIGGVLIGAIGAFVGILSIRIAIRADRRETAAAEAQRIRDAEDRGRQQARIESRLDNLDERVGHHGGDDHE